MDQGDLQQGGFQLAGHDCGSNSHVTALSRVSRNGLSDLLLTTNDEPIIVNVRKYALISNNSFKVRIKSANLLIRAKDVVSLDKKFF